MTRNSHRFVAAILAVAFGNSSIQAADLSGKFVYGAPAPAAAKLNIDKDVEAFGNLGLVDETLVVAPDGGIANVVVYVRTDGVAEQGRGVVRPVRSLHDSSLRNPLGPGAGVRPAARPR